MSFLKDIDEGNIAEEAKKETENKPKRKTYQEMFGYTWRGYGYSE
jgi:hypothetical protein